MLITLLTGCRQLAGYNGIVEEALDASTLPDSDTPDSEQPPDDSEIAETGADENTITSDANEDTSTPDAGSDAAEEADASDDTTVMADAPADAPTNDVAVVDTGADATADAPGDAGSCDPQPPKSGTNVVANPDFESTTSPGLGWTGAYGANFSVSSTQSHCGGHSGAIASRGAFYHCFQYAVVLPESTSYTYSLWVMQDGPSDLSMSLQPYSSSSTCTNMFGAVNYMPVHPNTWTRLTGTFTIATGCPTQYLYVVQQQQPNLPDGGPPPLPNLYVDDVYVIQQ